MSRRRVVIADPDANPPEYPWRGAPENLATRNQLREMGLRPGRQGVQGLLLWSSNRGSRPRIDGLRFANLFDTEQARPKLPLTPARAAALERADQARRTCPECDATREYVISTRLGMCNECASQYGIVD